MSPVLRSAEESKGESQGKTTSLAPGFNEASRRVREEVTSSGERLSAPFLLLLLSSPVEFVGAKIRRMTSEYSICR